MKSNNFHRCSGAAEKAEIYFIFLFFTGCTRTRRRRTPVRSVEGMKKGWCWLTVASSWLLREGKLDDRSSRLPPCAKQKKTRPHFRQIVISFRFLSFTFCRFSVGHKFGIAFPTFCSSLAVPNMGFWQHCQHSVPTNKQKNKRDACPAKSNRSETVLTFHKTAIKRVVSTWRVVVVVCARVCVTASISPSI